MLNRKATLIALLCCIWLARREKQSWPLMVWASGGVIAMYEPLNNILAHHPVLNP